MSDTASISSGIAARYATAIVEIAQEEGTLETLESDVAALSAALEESEELRDFIRNPIISRADLGKGIAAIADRMGLSPALRGGLGVMAQKRRLFVLPQLVARLREMIAEHKGEVTAQVVSAKALTKAQAEKLAAALKESFGKDVNIKASVDESLIGGLMVKVGSKMIDTSIRARLNSLQNAMKEVG